MKRIVTIIFKWVLGIHSPALGRKVKLSDIFNREYGGLRRDGNKNHDSGRDASLKAVRKIADGTGDVEAIKALCEESEG